MENEDDVSERGRKMKRRRIQKQGYHGRIFFRHLHLGSRLNVSNDRFKKLPP